MIKLQSREHFLILSINNYFISGKSGVLMEIFETQIELS